MVGSTTDVHERKLLGEEVKPPPEICRLAEHSPDIIGGSTVSCGIYTSIPPFQSLLGSRRNGQTYQFEFIYQRLHGREILNGCGFSDRQKGH